MELIAANIDSKNAGGAALQKNLGKAACGSARVQANAILGREAESIERRLQLPSAARDIAFSFSDMQHRVECHLKPRLECWRTRHTDRATLYQVLRLRPGAD